jgi:hypothetical protein
MLKFEINRIENPNDWLCTRCGRYNRETAQKCDLCGSPPGPLISDESLDRGGSASFLVAAGAGGTSKEKKYQYGMCLRNKSVETLWLYTEQIAPLSWVQLRPGECCDMPCGNVWYTIGASFDEPNPSAAVLGIFGFAATVLAVVVLCVLPEPGSKVAVAAYLAGAVATLTGGGTGIALLCVSNKSQMKCAGVKADAQVWDIKSDLDGLITRTNGDRLRVYSYYWKKADVDWEQRHDRYAVVTFGTERDIKSLKPVDAKVIDELKVEAAAGDHYLGQMDEWQKKGVLEQRVFTFGGDGGKRIEVTFPPRTSAEGKAGLIQGVRVAANKFIDGVQVKYTDRQEWEPVLGSDAAKKLGIFKSPQKLDDHLGKGGQLCCEAGDYIETIVVKHDKYVCQLTFKSHLGRTLTVGGRDKDGRTETTIGGPNMGWLGFQLKSGSWVDRMTFLMESTI